VEPRYGKDVRNPRPVEVLDDIFGDALFLPQYQGLQHISFGGRNGLADTFPDERTVSFKLCSESIAGALPDDDDIRGSAYVSAEANALVEEIFFVIESPRIVEGAGFFQFCMDPDVIAVFDTLLYL
jgi:hypothetical protein